MNNDQLELGGYNKAAKSLIRLTNPDDKTAGLHFGIGLFIIAIFTGQIFVKVFFRKKFTLHSRSLLHIILTSACFITVSVYSFISITPTNTQFQSISNYTVSVLFLALAIQLLAKGINHLLKYNEKTFKYNSGESTILAFLIKDNKKAFTQIFVEPFLTLAFGFFTYAFSEIGGIVLMACAASYWLALLSNYITGRISNHYQTVLKPQNQQQAQVHRINPNL